MGRKAKVEPLLDCANPKWLAAFWVDALDYRDSEGSPRSKPTTYPAPSPPDCSGDHAVKDNIDGEAKPLVAIAGDHLRGVGGDNWEPV
jgi:hypothetical protein